MRTALQAGYAKALGALVIFLLSALPGSLVGQQQRGYPVVTVASVSPMHESEAESTTTYARRRALVLRSLEIGLTATSRADSLSSLSLSVDTAFALIEMAPDDAEAHYLYAVALGQRLELAGTKEKVRLGALTRSEAEAALALDPNHAGAHHVVGRLNAATMRMSRVARFVARRILGAKALEGASWDQAEHHFMRALELEPWNPRHSMELGMLYADTGRPEDAIVALEIAIAAPQARAGDSLAVDQARRLRWSLDCGSC